MNFKLSERLESLPPYIFSQINVLKAEATKKGIKLLSLGIGDPDLPTPSVLVEKMKEAISKPENHLYSPYEGSLLFREAATNYMKRRFGVDVDANKEIVTLIGSKEGIAHFPLAFINPGDTVMYPSPGYPVFQTAMIIAGAKAIPIPLTADKGFLPDPNEVEKLFKEHKPKYVLFNFPSNPTSAVASKALLTDLVNLARKYQVILGYDNAYSEIYYNGVTPPPSILEIPGAKEVAIEFHSLSKTFNMTGWRIAFAVGNADLVSGLLKMKTNVDSGPLLSVQEVGAHALDNAEKITPPIRNVYTERLATLLKGLDSLGIEYLKPEATFFIWAKVPGGKKSFDFTKDLIEKQGLVVTPGVGFGKEGEGFFRMALTVPNEKITEFLNRLSTATK